MVAPIHQFLNFDDQQLYQMAEYQTMMDTKGKKPASNSLLLSIPLIDSFARATFKDGSVGNKSMTFGKSILGWCGILGLIGIYNSALNGLKKNIPAVKKFDQEHPVASTALNWIGFWVAMDYGFKGYKKLTDKLIEKFPEKYATFTKHKNDLINKIDKSWLDTKVYKPLCNGFAKLEGNYPQLAKGLKYALPFVAPAIAIAATVKTISFVHGLSDKTKENYYNLKAMQNSMKQQIYSDDYE